MPYTDSDQFDEDKSSDIEDSSENEDSAESDSDGTDCDLTTSKVYDKQSSFSLMGCLMYVLFIWYVKWRISDRAFNWLLKILYSFFLILGHKKQQLPPFFSNITNAPRNLAQLMNFVQFNKQNFVKYVVCPNPTCTKLYMLSDLTELDGTGQLVALPCNECGSTLVKEKVLGNGKKVFHPLKVYCYKSIQDSLKILLSSSEFQECCSSWRKRQMPSNCLGDIYDGKVWKDFASLWSSDGDSIDLALMLNCDWFQPFKRRSNVSIGVLYAVVANLPPSMRFKPENILLIGVLPALSKEPSSLNSFLQPVIENLLTLKNGVKMGMKKNITARLICTSSDIPATRKLGGFLGHSAILGCSKCLKTFDTMTINGSKKRNYSGFQRDVWIPRTNQQHRADILKISKSRNDSERVTLEKKLGCRYSALLELDYFDPVIHHVVDPMHNLFLGTAKRMFKLWIDLGLLRLSSLKEIDTRIKSLPVPSELGRIPTAISSNYGNFTAAEWKNWTLVYSLYCLQGLLADEHLVCWQTFVLACQTLCKPLIFLTDVKKADFLLLKFCRNVQELYGSGVITPNMHMHGHLANCVEHYGPIFSFWLFSFERYNGILGKFANNKKDIEVQLMRKFLAITHTKSISSDLVSYIHNNPVAAQLATNDLMSVDSESFERLISKETYFAPLLSISSVKWNNSDVYLPKKCSLVSLDKDDVNFLVSVYSVLFPHCSFSSDTLPLVCRKYPYVHIGLERFGHRSDQKKCYILAAWANTTGHINTESYILRPGLIKHFLHHSCTMPVKAGSSSEVTLETTFAVVQWFGFTPRSDQSFLSPLVEFSNDLIPSGPATFLPVKRIAALLAVGINHTANPREPQLLSKIGIPLPRKNIYTEPV